MKAILGAAERRRQSAHPARFDAADNKLHAIDAAGW
jgi:hypothetical protein